MDRKYQNANDMDKREVLKIVALYLASIGGIYKIESAYLFGSFAKGTQHEDSDIDIAIVIDDSNDIIDTQIELMKLRRKVDLRIEPHPFLKADFNKSNPVASEIMKWGIAL